MTSTLATETQARVSGCRASLEEVEAHLRPLLEKDGKEVPRRLAPLEHAELKVALAYTAASLYFSHLLTQGIDPASHPVQQELGRIQTYFKKVRATKEKIVAQAEAKARKRIDVEAARRIVQTYAMASEAAGARQGRAAGGRGPQVARPPAATGSTAAPEPVDLVEDEPAAPEGDATVPHPLQGEAATAQPGKKRPAEFAADLLAEGAAEVAGGVGPKKKARKGKKRKSSAQL